MFDAKELAKKAKAAGMKYAVLTTKHHEGFCLFDTKYTDYNVMNTPFGRDIVREYVDAFREEGLKIGLYYSLIDWHHPDFTIDFNHPRRNDENAEELDKGRDVSIYTEYMRISYKVGNVLLFEVLVHKFLAAHELVHKAQGVHHGDHAVEAADLGQGLIAKADGLRDGQGLADAGSFDKDVVEAVRFDEVEYLFEQVGLQGTADTAVFEGNEAVVFQFHGAALGNEGGVDIYLADIIYDNSDLVAFLIGEHVIEQGGLARAEVAGQNSDGDYLSSHYVDLSFKGCMRHR